MGPGGVGRRISERTLRTRGARTEELSGGVAAARASTWARRAFGGARPGQAGRTPQASPPSRASLTPRNGLWERNGKGGSAAHASMCRHRDERGEGIRTPWPDQRKKRSAMRARLLLSSASLTTRPGRAARDGRAGFPSPPPRGQGAHRRVTHPAAHQTRRQGRAPATNRPTLSPAISDATQVNRHTASQPLPCAPACLPCCAERAGASASCGGAPRRRQARQHIGGRRGRGQVGVAAIWGGRHGRGTWFLRGVEAGRQGQPRHSFGYMSCPLRYRVCVCVYS
ncbi:hypothetical protein PAHAL_6G250500 [Panicum hallii]|uniref:Uncharacterized protein n=1 Tax=Panicum hallii TaxID=206008 RepID=A0A2S3I3K6_9POAL|nr:hypothetical protein PAHAL_6G250500 [Panicum hallii]